MFVNAYTKTTALKRSRGTDGHKKSPFGLFMNFGLIYLQLQPGLLQALPAEF